MSMVQLLDYRIEDKLYERERFVTYRAHCLSDQKKVILKTVPGDYPDLKAIAALQYEYSLLQKLHVPGVIQARKLMKEGDRQILVLEDIEGQTLKEWLGGKPVKIKDFFKISMQLAKIIKTLHQHHIIHKDINPNNIIINPVNLNVTIIDFNISTELSFESQEILNTLSLEGSLAYISPEQTGRSNHILDLRTDFYSLGVTFFEMLTGRLPFESEDELELVYCHLAESPPNPKDYNMHIPSALSSITLKLLAKMPEERYQTAEGLEADLLECAQQWRQQKKITHFTSGQYDINDHLVISQRLYGRENEIKMLLNAFDEVSTGQVKFLTVSGYAGVGKTSLVKEIYKPITRQHGYFISGKYDQLQRTTPYSAIIEAFQGLVRHLLAEPKDRITKIKKDLLKALGNNGRVIDQVIPNISLIIGPQPPLQALPPIEEQNRFILTFRNLVRTLAQPEHPLVVFLDDLQWVDNSSLQLLQLLLTDQELKYFLLIGSYRNNEVTADHPLIDMLEQMQKSNVFFDNLLLAPLKGEDITHWLADSLNTNTNRVADLSHLLLTKTQGNPFFINEFLKNIYQQKLLYFAYSVKQWVWDINKIKRQAMTENVVDLLSLRICQLSASTQRALKLGACIGHSFDMQTLSVIAAEETSELGKHLWSAIQAGLIIPLDEGSKIRLLIEDQHLLETFDLKKLSYQFIHDRVQQAAYQLIEPQEQQSIHLKIGRLLLKERPLQEHDESLFKILDHINQCISLIDSSEEKYQLAQYNLWAGQKAKAGMAFFAAINYLHAGINLITPLDWKVNYDLIFMLKKDLATCYYLTSEFDKVQELIDEILPKTKSDASKLQLYKLNCEMLATLKNHHESLKIGLKALQIIDINLPLAPNTWDALMAIFQIKWQTLGVTIQDINLPLLENQVYLEATKLIAQLCNSAYFVNQKLLVLLTCQLVRISLKHGRWESTPTFFLAYAFLIMHGLGWYKEGLAYTELYKKLRSLTQYCAFDARNHVILGTCIAPWYMPLNKCAEILRTAYPLGYEAGDLIYTTHSCTSLILTIFMIGNSLAKVKKAIEKTLLFVDRVKMSDTKNMILTWQYVVDCLLGQQVFTRERLAVFEKENLADNNNTQISFFYSMCAKIYYILGNFAAAREAGLNHFKYAEFGLASVSNFEGLFYYALALMADKEHKVDKHKTEKELTKIRKQFKRWAEWCPRNYQHYLLLFDAEFASFKKHVLRAMDFYDQAIKLAHENDDLAMAAIASECAARFFQTLNNPISAKGYILNSHYIYQRWGALAKCFMLEAAYPDLFRQVNITVPDAQSTTELTVNKQVGSLDLLAILKAVQVIANEIDPTRLLKQLILTLLKNAGAQKGLLIVKKHDQWRIEAETAQHDEVILSKMPVEKSKELPLTIFNYVQRTAEIVLLNNATNEGDFKNDAYIIEKQPKSILCMPFMQHHETLAILYLENNAINGAFTNKHLAALKLLAGQVAISLENSQLYAAGKLFVPFEFLLQLNKRNLTEINLGDHIQKQLSILFCDIQGFTRLSEELTTADNFKFINYFLGLMEPIITKHGGFIDKYIGDAIMALFDQKPDTTIKAAVAMQKRLNRENKQRIKQLLKPIHIGVGINTGDLMLGMIGSSHHLENSVIGDAVNIAAHIEHLTRKYGVNLLISGETKAALLHPENFQLRLIATDNLKGKKNAIDIYEVCNVYTLTKRNLIKETLKTFNKALHAYKEEEFNEAYQLFKSVLSVNPTDHVAKFYLRKCKRR